MGSPAPVNFRRSRRAWRARPPRAQRSLWRSLFDTGIFFAAALLVLAAIRVFDQLTLTPGTADIIDGDSFRIGRDEIRLSGIDAPEYHQQCLDENGRDWSCGKDAARALRTLVSRREVKCTGIEIDRYGRLVSRCTVGGVELNSEMVRLGWAVVYESHGRPYAEEEAEARRDKRGIWRGSFDWPADWRQRHRAE